MSRRRGASWRGSAGAMAGVACTLFLVSCGGGGDEQSDSSVTVKGFEYGFEMPAEVKGGLTKMTFENDGAAPHEWGLGKLAPGKTAQDISDYVDRTKGAPPSLPWITDVGGVPPISSGGEFALTRDLTPGNYAFICFLPAPNGESHAKLGMIKGFTVSGAAGGEPPASDGSITLTDKEFRLSPLTAGPQTIEFKNAATKTRGFELYSLVPGRTFKDVDKWASSGFAGKAPAIFYGGIQKVKAGESNYIDIDLKAGVEYVILNDEDGIQKSFKAA